MGSDDGGDNISDHSCDSRCSCNWDWNNLTFSQQEAIDEIYKAGDDYYASHPDSPQNFSQVYPGREIGTTSNPQPITTEVHEAISQISLEGNDEGFDHSCDSRCSCNWDWNNLTFSQQEAVDEMYRGADAYYEEAPDSSLNIPQISHERQSGSTSNHRPVSEDAPQPITPRIDYKSKQWKDCKMFIESGGKILGSFV